MLNNERRENVVQKKLENSLLLAHAKTQLPCEGVLACDASRSYYYLDIDDRFITELFPLIQISNVSLPRYFSAEKGHIGAHISVIYSSEISDKTKSARLNILLGKSFFFTLEGFFSLFLNDKTFFALVVDAPALINLRNALDLPALLNYHGFSVPLHITLGVSKTS